MSLQSRTRLPVVPRQRPSPEAEAPRPPESAAPIAVPVAVPAEVPAQRAPQDGLGQLTAMALDGFTGLRRVHRSPRRALLLAIWLVGIVGDAATTLLLLDQPGHSE